MISEIATAAKEIGTNATEASKSFDPDAKAEVSKNPLDNKSQSFDPDAKAEVSKATSENDNKTFDPDAKAEPSGTAETKQNEAGETAENKENRIKCRNEDLAGKKHPETDVPFTEKTVTDETGNEVTGVFPEFDSTYDAQLPKDLEKASDKEQFKECNKQLKEAVENDPELAKQFDEEQLEQIENGDTPDGYTWHHNEEHGKMQLVDSDTHAKTGHTGGKVIWGGGSENR